jgi:hypothetical protein
MPQALYFVPPRGPFVDPATGALTRTADMFLRGLYARVGGSTGDSTADLSASAFDDAGTEEQEAALYALADAQGQRPPPPVGQEADDLAAEVAHLREELAVLRQQINDIKQGQV